MAGIGCISGELACIKDAYECVNVLLVDLLIRKGFCNPVS